MFQNYGSPTSVTRLKVVPNMADPISLNENLPVAFLYTGILLKNCKHDASLPAEQAFMR